MAKFDWQNAILTYDDRRDFIIPGNVDETVLFCVQQFIDVAQQSIQARGKFVVALSGGSTPNAIFKKLSTAPFINQIDWSKVYLFWSDERSVPPDHADSNYRQALEAGLGILPVPRQQIYRMVAEENIQLNAQQYEESILKVIPDGVFDLMMLGMGEDGHTASLFPQTEGLSVTNRLAIANYVPQKNTWRMSLTYDCIHRARIICIYVIGKNKAYTVAQIFSDPYDPKLFPIQKVGTQKHKAIWILDREAASIVQKC